MKKLVLIAGMMLSQSALADGFVCQTMESDLNVRIYNHTQPEMGTRSAAIMVLSDPVVSYGRKTIAKFSAVKGTLSSERGNPSWAEMVYTADVDLRFTDSARKGENISSTKLGELAKISVLVKFSYASPVADGTELAGQMTLVKRNGEVLVSALTCSRYLKN